MASQQVNEIDEIVKGLKKTPGYKGYLILNNDGVVIRWDQEDKSSSNSSSTKSGSDGSDNNKSDDNESESDNGNDDDGPMTYETAVQYSHHIIDLCSKSKAHIKELLDDDDEEVESVRVRTNHYELIVAEEGNYILAVIYVGRKNKDPLISINNHIES